MSNFFNEVMNDSKGVEEKLLGPDYPYYKFIATPAEMGMSSEGSLSTTADDIAGLINYVQMMVGGKGPANMSPNSPLKGGGSSQPLGDKFFLKTGAQCMDSKTQQLVDRYIYINNIPDGSIPFLTQGAGIQFTDFEGLVPGIMEDLGAMNPISIFKGFMQGNNPPCTEITLDTIGQPPEGNSNPNIKGTATFHVSNSDIKEIDPCTFPGGGGNPLTDTPCKDTFRTINPAEDNYSNFYIFLCALLLLFIVQKLLKKN